ncbi:hypothetical protein SARC_02641 [Sphaeroforma arctica JP610]|uniref:Uncharacterized protein n=1 Tax=Sphaeroforma arctica JP610 TaxID=667725 RepID=A0A0L0GA81_9EUKA|nr:hypothetical protein SARC_02641 [Sphaeroforma arctica JP610]KNC85148.1 hypothetical protein SARC_02641 [Sphaeroforma arctica JP610]|eukprot:XP_014159050.1 hypothetical protein SARC_02641 [Sphaeroforma arctica JP610]
MEFGEKILSQSYEVHAKKKYRERRGTHHELEKRLIEWVSKVREAGFSVNPGLIVTKGKEYLMIVPRIPPGVTHTPIGWTPNLMDVDEFDEIRASKNTEQAVSLGDIDSESEQVESYTFASQYNDQEGISDTERLQELRDSSLGEATKWVEDVLEYSHQLSEAGNVKGWSYDKNCNVCNANLIKRDWRVKGKGVVDAWETDDVTSSPPPTTFHPAAIVLALRSESEIFDVSQ